MQSIGKYIFSLSLITLVMCQSAFACISDGPPEYKSYSITDEVQNGKSFSRAVEQSGLYFHLTSTINGWSFMINNTSENTDGDYIYPVNPPYRYNPLQYIDYSYNQGSPLKWDERVFSFTSNELDYQTAIESVRDFLWPKDRNNPTEPDDIDAMIDTLGKGKGIFKILESQTEHTGQQPKITLLRFEVTLDIPVIQKCHKK